MIQCIQTKFVAVTHILDPIVNQRPVASAIISMHGLVAGGWAALDRIEVGHPGVSSMSVVAAGGS